MIRLNIKMRKNPQKGYGSHLMQNNTKKKHARHFLLANFSVESNILLHSIARKLQQIEDPTGSVPDAFHLTLVYMGERVESDSTREFSLVPLRHNLSFPEAFKIRGIYRFHSPEGDSAGYSLHLEQCQQLGTCVSYLAREAETFYHIHEKQQLNNPHITLLSSEKAKHNPTVCLLPRFQLPSSLNLQIRELELTAADQNDFVSLNRVVLTDKAHD